MQTKAKYLLVSAFSPAPASVAAQTPALFLAVVAEMAQLASASVSETLASPSACSSPTPLLALVGRARPSAAASTPKFISSLAEAGLLLWVAKALSTLADFLKITMKSNSMTLKALITVWPLKPSRFEKTSTNPSVG